MTSGTIYHQGWTLDDVRWDAFDASKIDPQMLAAVKAAALVEYNAPDYVTYLKRIFHDAGPEALAAIDQWGVEETQHGQALARWAKMADPDFDMDAAFARFRAGYQPEHFADTSAESVRGSRRGEMIARCVVESGTSSYYSAIRDGTDEPVLKEVAGRIAADEFRHYKLFLDTMNEQSEPELPFWKKLMVALGRVNESDDDEIAYAYYAANISADIPYDRVACSHATHANAVRLYRRHHVRKLTQMVAKAVGMDPQGRLTTIAGALMWRMLKLRAGQSHAVTAETAAA
jgi:hypothetical protein